MAELREPPSAPPSGLTHRGRVVRWFLAAGAVAALIAGVSLFSRRRIPASPGSSPSATRQSVAVLGFANHTERADRDWVSVALSEMLAAELEGGETLQIVSGERVDPMKRELGIRDGDPLTPHILARIRQRLGSQWVVVGAYADGSGDMLQLDVRVQDTASGGTLASVKTVSPAAELPGLVAQATSQLRQHLGLATPTSTPPGTAVHLSRPEAMRLYAEGLARLRAFDAVGAREQLEKAVDLEPTHPLPHLALAEAWAALGEEAKAREEASQAFARSHGLVRERALRVEARYRELAADWDRAIQLYKALLQLFPDEIEYAVRLAQAQATAGKPAEARATIEAARRAHPAANDDPQVDLAEARAAAVLGEFTSSATAASRAADEATAQGARLVVAQARLAQANALQALGDRSAAVVACDDARRLFEESGNRGGVAHALIETANILRYQGSLEASGRAATEALRISREIGDTGATVFALNRIASVDAEMGRLTNALDLYRQTLPLWKQVGQRNREVTALNNIGETLWKLARLSEARKTLDQAVADFREIGDRRGLAFSSRNLGHVLLDLGEVAAARKAFEESQAVARDIGFRSIQAEALYGLGELARISAHPSEALARHEQALAIRRELKETTRSAESQLALGRLALEASDPGRAETLASEAARQFHSERLAQREGLAHGLMAEARLAAGRLPEAHDEASKALALVARSEHRALRLTVALAAARVRAAAPAEGVDQALESAEQEARAAGLKLLELQARLQIAQRDLAQGHESAKAELHRVYEEAQAAGLTQLAHAAEGS